jgi:hypothetical protein
MSQTTKERKMQEAILARKEDKKRLEMKIEVAESFKDFKENHKAYGYLKDILDEKRSILLHRLMEVELKDRNGNITLIPASETQLRQRLFISFIEYASIIDEFINNKKQCENKLQEIIELEEAEEKKKNEENQTKEIENCKYL